MQLNAKNVFSEPEKSIYADNIPRCLDLRFSAANSYFLLLVTLEPCIKRRNMTGRGEKRNLWPPKGHSKGPKAKPLDSSLCSSRFVPLHSSVQLNAKNVFSEPEKSIYVDCLNPL